MNWSLSFFALDQLEAAAKALGRHIDVTLA
jgi:hypothetical protein